MTAISDEVKGQAPAELLALLKDRASEFGISAGTEDNAQTIKCRLEGSGGDWLSYTYTQLFPGKLLKEAVVTITFRPGPGGRGTAVTAGGRHIRTEAPPGTAVDGDTNVDHEARTVWTYIKNMVTLELNARKEETITRTYNAGLKELFFMLRDPSLLVPPSYVAVESDGKKGLVKFQDPTGSLVYSVALADCHEPDRLTYELESNTSNMWVRSGRVELHLEKVHPAKSVLTARATSNRTQVSEQMRLSAMYLPSEQLSGYLSFRQDLGMLVGWIDAAVPLRIPHIRDMIVVQGDFVAGGKIEIRDSVVNRTTLETGPPPDEGKYIVHAERTAGDKVEVKDSIVSRSVLGGRGKNVEVYGNSLEAAFMDGRIDDSEAAMIEMLQQSLGITPEDNLRVLEGLHRLDSDEVRLYDVMLRKLLADGGAEMSPDALEKLRVGFRIPLVVHQALMTRLRSR